MQSLAEKWRQEGVLYRRRGLTREAEMAESFATEQEATVREMELEALTLDEAVRESGYSYSSIQRKLASGS